MKAICLTTCFLLISIGIPLSFFVPQTYALNTVSINELMPHPSSGNDWVEIYNASNATVDVTNWQLKDKGTSAIKTLSGSIAPLGFFIIDASNRLDNAGDTVTLVDNLATTIDTYAYATDPGLDKTLGRVPDGSGNFFVLVTPSKNVTNGTIIPETPQPTPTPNPSTPTPVPTQTPTPSSQSVGGPIYTTGISLSEYLPAPNTGEDEWVELYNNTTDEANVGGWMIDDIDGGSQAFTIPGDVNSALIPPLSYKVFIMPSARFNNAGDTIRLLTPDGTVVEESEYADAKTNVSFAKDGAGTFQETTSLTPGSQNSIVSPNTPQSSLSPKATSQTKKATTTPNVLGATSQNDGKKAIFKGTQTYKSQEKEMNTTLPNLLGEATESATPEAVYEPLIQGSSRISPDVLQYGIGVLVIISIGGMYWFFRYHRKMSQ